MTGLQEGCLVVDEVDAVGEVREAPAPRCGGGGHTLLSSPPQTNLTYSESFSFSTHLIFFWLGGSGRRAREAQRSGAITQYG